MIAETLGRVGLEPTPKAFTKPFLYKKPKGLRKVVKFWGKSGATKVSPTLAGGSPFLDDAAA